ncbi:hypothetical protein A2962_04920 [Candidatus Woesebacteria bacterium RIFCSPLOWO2_01_FULL_39_61]|uniref:DegT/DnrJ/EryC1/StrS aminotransferase n=1 Tax=Candidatus Woesebacteria bacterium RIFCSPHIGHO2_02_FULL_39_13 TaxID=1802505 RepID=A0A1F7YZG8_9BACT|nr:MAG: hypothetical protein A2692_03170 [Candidatus Woesebacteria bacterium RIFCSPHIGHO2_01_FULL_39_95]OGM32610.1 MAG: hypothetical protein A3D01_05145 [Candidatus Woesebacteria bacterium RIFCSPHIGHO2_02_FULL_39_13]OGM36407.1 MAG: hypothetical protein A3E13_00690 [Candidatus Woesebacteria bacterium RIFCSPHIGHO2_12_FULL_40_20]OGM66678.1 MAG: hypothetical protein A2962_04920 [Candidatus Woesebacteria bacterium RIFCSPLOWO2_01_FULL_39_61]OGM72965.1 MAG: hypothetical protein A3H19_01370 [Candidatus
MRRSIAISLSPNCEKDDISLALKLLFSPFSWFDFRQTEGLENDFKKLFGSNYQFLAVDSGRSALYLILKALGISEGDEVLLQGFTCVAVPNSVIWTGAKPVYVDVDKNFNIDIGKIKEKITEKTKAIIVQHSFGIPVDIQKVRRVVRNKRIVIIEDCALSLGAENKGKKVGTLGDISFFSFGRDKVISSVFGGMILSKNKKIYEKLKQERYDLNYPSAFWLIQQLLHPIFFSLILLTYNLGFGKLTIGKMSLFLLQSFNILSKAVSEDEKKGKKPKRFLRKMPGALAVLARNQLRKLEKFNRRRRNISNYYFSALKIKDLQLPVKIKGSIYMRFPILSSRSIQIFRCMKRQGILFGDWYKAPVVPVYDLSLVEYQPLTCRNAEKYSRTILNIPTNPTMTLTDAKEVVRLIKLCLNTK